jgi:phospho-N-acetylmuramoyl-pentapeptide-transferase
MIISLVATRITIRIFGRMGRGQPILGKEDHGPEHEHKAGTPTMGGLAIIAAGFLGYLASHIRSEAIKFADTAIALWFLILGLAFVGWLDDYLGVRRARNLGLRKRGKTGGIILVTIGFALLGLEFVKVSTHLSFTRPFDLDLGTIGWFLWAIIVVYATSNAVNITDGLDGLVAGSSALVFAAFVVIGFTQFRHPHAYHLLAAGSIDVAVVAAALMGACVGFLWWNAPPARVFMGDTGALALGGAMAGMGLLTKTDLLLPIIGGLYVLEISSVMAQVISFRGFGRRILRMSPIHHHFEILGWPESTILVRFWILAGLAMALGLGFFYADFIRIPGIIE